ncbi:MAG TPA: hypothetical protein DEQ88_01625 [Clostridiales bacterium]|nr:hypothetical protein [Clostridiales bacterium]
MSLESYQRKIDDFVLICYNEYLPLGGKRTTFYERGWFEEMYTFNFNILGEDLPIQVYVHFDLFERGKGPDGEQLYSVTSRLGFRVPYIDRLWQADPLQPMRFTIKPDIIYSGHLDFSYNGSHGNNAINGIIPVGQNMDSTIAQFCADVMANLDGPYQYIIGKYNGLC